MEQRPQLVASWFGTGSQGEMFRRLADVLEYSAVKHNPAWQVNVAHLEPPPHPSAIGQPSHEWNTQKMEHWVQRALAAPNGALVALLDGDTMVTGPLDEVWKKPFDVAYTIRDGDRLPLNAGVVFLRISDLTRAFMRDWWAWNLHFLNPMNYPDVNGQKEPHAFWRRRYAGINQASLGYMLEKAPHGCQVLKLPCSIWNCCSWERYEEGETRIVHVKSALRRRVFQLPPITPKTPKVQELCNLWHRMEAEAKAARALCA